MRSNGFLNIYMGVITGTIIKTMMQVFLTVLFIEIEIVKSVYFNSMVSLIDLDILNLWFRHHLQWVTF